jgi:hypothetical protein
MAPHAHAAGGRAADMDAGRWTPDMLRPAGGHRTGAEPAEAAEDAAAGGGAETASRRPEASGGARIRYETSLTLDALCDHLYELATIHRTSEAVCRAFSLVTDCYLHSASSLHGLTALPRVGALSSFTAGVSAPTPRGHAQGGARHWKALSAFAAGVERLLSARRGGSPARADPRGADLLRLAPPAKAVLPLHRVA